MDSSPEREKQVFRELDSMDNALGDLKVVVDNVENILYPVLLDGAPREPSIETVEETLVGLASTIRNHRRKIVELTTKLEEIVDRLEI